MINIETFNIGEKLKQAVKESRLSWKEIAEKTKIPEQTLYKLAKSKDIKVHTLLKIAYVLDTPMEFFFGVTENDLVKELRKLLDEERSKKDLLTKTLEIAEQQFSMIITLMKELEKQEKPSQQTKLTLVESDGETKEISFSHFFMIYMRMMSASRSPNKEEMYWKYAQQFFNIIEIREALKGNPLLIPGGIVGILGETIENQAVDAFIDLKEIFKNLK